MSFQPKEILIVPKGLNLLAPGDQAAEGDCLQLDGWWPGSVGRLQQARGWVKKNYTTDAVTLDSLCEASEILFAAGGGNLYMGTQNGAAMSKIDTGYDGQPLGMCAYQGMAWIMNRARQVRVETGARTPNGSSTVAGTVRTWGVPSPGSAPTATVSGGGALADGSHAYYITIVDQWGYESDPSPAAGVWCPDYPYPPGLTDGTVSLTNGSATVNLSGASWDATIDGQQFLIPSEYPTITPPAESPYYIKYVSSTQGTLTDLEGNALNWAGTTVSGASYVIYSREAPSTGSGFYNSAKVTIASPSSGAGLSGWNLYHQSPGLNGPYLVNPAVLAFGTPYVDYGDPAHSQDDDSLLALDVLMEADHDPPPACRVMADVPYNGRLVVGNSSKYPNRIWWTNALQPSYFPGSSNPQAGNWADIGADTGDAILRISVRPGALIIYRQRSIWRITGDLGDPASVIAPLVPNMGIVGPRAVVGTGWGDIAVVKQGVTFGLYRVTDWEQRVGGKIETILAGVATENYAPVASAYASNCSLGYQLGRLWFSYPDNTSSGPANRTLICDIEQDQFTFSVAGRWFGRAGGFSCYLHGWLFFLACGGGAVTGQNVYSLDDGNGDQDGYGVPLGFQSRYEDCGNPDHEKTWADLVINHNTQNRPLTVALKINKGASSIALGTIQSTSMTRQVFPILSSSLPVDAFNAAVSITGTGPTAPVSWNPALIDGPLILHYFLKPRRAMQWDSGPTDHGVTGAKIVDALEIDYDGSTGLTLFLQSDIPGGVMTERTTGGTGISVAATTGRQVIRVILPAAVAGRIFRYQLYAAGASPAAYCLYAVRARILPAPIFVDGSFGDTWYTEPIAPGVE